MALATYSSRDVAIAWGSTQIEALAPDSFVTVEQNADITDEEVGADGQVAISITPDNTATITIALQQQSPTNLVLSQIAKIQKSSRVLKSDTMLIKDRSGSIAWDLKECHLKSIPSQSAGSTATGSNREWVFFSSNAVPTAAPAGVQMDQATSDSISSTIENAADDIKDGIVNTVKGAAIGLAFNAVSNVLGGL